MRDTPLYLIISSKSLRSGIFKLPATGSAEDSTRKHGGPKGSKLWHRSVIRFKFMFRYDMFKSFYYVAAWCGLSGSGLPRPLITFFMVFKSSLIASGTKSGIRVQSLHRKNTSNQVLLVCVFCSATGIIQSTMKPSPLQHARLLNCLLVRSKTVDPNQS